MRRMARAGWQAWHVAEARVIHAEGAATQVRSHDERRRRPDYWYDSSPDVLREEPRAGLRARHRGARRSGRPRPFRDLGAEAAAAGAADQLPRRLPTARDRAAPPRARGPMPDARIGAIAIGRNEGERLIRLPDLPHAGGGAGRLCRFGSTDGSVAAARGLGAEVVELDLSVPVHRGAGAQRGSCATGAKAGCRRSSSSSTATASSTGLGRRCRQPFSRRIPMSPRSAAAGASGTPRRRSGTSSSTANGTRPSARRVPAAAMR